MQYFMKLLMYLIFYKRLQSPRKRNPLFYRVLNFFNRNRPFAQIDPGTGKFWIDDNLKSGHSGKGLTAAELLEKAKNGTP